MFSSHNDTIIIIIIIVINAISYGTTVLATINLRNTVIKCTTIGTAWNCAFQLIRSLSTFGLPAKDLMIQDTSILFAIIINNATIITLQAKKLFI